MNIKLNKHFDQDELIRSFESVKEFNKAPAGYPGEGNVNWDAITLFSLGNEEASLLSKLPFLSATFKALNLNIRLLRFMILEPGGIIQKHQDSFLSNSIVRLHIPVITHPDVEFYLNHERCNWFPGELWYGDFSLEHYGINNSNVSRVHLVMDVTVDENLLKLFPPHEVTEKLKANQHNTGADSQFDPVILERFRCNFTLPSGFSLPGLNYSELQEELNGSIKVVGNELSLFVNDQPLLKVLPVTEDKLALIGLGQEAFVNYRFGSQGIKNLELNIFNMVVPISLAN